MDGEQPTFGRQWAAARDQLKGVSVAQIALAWLLHQSHVTSVIVGAKRIAQLDDNVGATEVQLSANEVARLNEVSELTKEYPAWMQRVREVPPKPPLSAAPDGSD